MDPLNALLNTYQTATQSWMGSAVDAGNEIFRRLAALELVVFGLAVALKGRRSAASVLPDLAWKLFLIALLLTGLLTYPLWVPTITPSFAAVAGDITGFSTLNPTVVLSQGISLAMFILSGAISKGWVFGDPFGAVIGAWTALFIVLAFVAIAAIMTKTLIESWIVLAGGPFFLGFAPFRPTAQIADNFITYAFHVGIKLFFLILLISVAQQVIVEWAQLFLAAGRFDFQLLFEMLAGSIILAVALWSIPTRIADFLTRGWSLGIRQGLEG